MITIFTPTYNRGYILKRLYNSLKKQSNKNFEWIIVDDGSTDNTTEIVDNWMKENIINIKYYKQENQGKMIAHNLGVEKAKGELFVCVDSDDWLNKDAVSIVLDYWHKNNQNGIIGIVCPRVDKNNNFIGRFPTKKLIKSTLIDLYGKYGLKGDTMLIYKTSIIKKYSFPKIEDEKFIPETYLYDKLDQEGELLLLNEKLYNVEYLQDGYSKNIKKIIKKNPKGYCLYAKNRIVLAKTVKQKYKAAAQYILCNWIDNKKVKIRDEKNKIIIFFAIPAAYIIYLKYYKGN